MKLPHDIGSSTSGSDLIQDKARFILRGQVQAMEAKAETKSNSGYQALHAIIQGPEQDAVAIINEIRVAANPQNQPAFYAAFKELQNRGSFVPTAALHGNPETLQALKENGFVTNGKIKVGNTPLTAEQIIENIHGLSDDTKREKLSAALQAPVRRDVVNSPVVRAPGSKPFPGPSISVAPKSTSGMNNPQQQVG